MFKDIDSEKIACLLSLLNGNVHSVVSVCLKGLSIKTILRVFMSANMLTRIKKVVVHDHSLVQDGLCIYK